MFFLYDSRKCKEDEFTCPDGICILNDYRCDGEADCRDGSDEAKCRESRELFSNCMWTYEFWNMKWWMTWAPNTRYCVSQKYFRRFIAARIISSARHPGALRSSIGATVMMIVGTRAMKKIVQTPLNHVPLIISGTFYTTSQTILIQNNFPNKILPLLPSKQLQFYIFHKEYSNCWSILDFLIEKCVWKKKLKI